MDDTDLPSYTERILLQLMHLLYNLGIRLYGVAIILASMFNEKAKKWITGRRNWKAHLPDISADQKVFWFHCASLGEFDQGLPLMELIRNNKPNAYILITFFSPSGMEFHHKRQHPGDHVMYLPLDTPTNAKTFVHHFKPESAFFIKYEFWLNYIFTASKINTSLYNVSGIFRPEQRFFRASGKLFADALKLFKHLYVQNETSKKLLMQIGVDQVSIVGDCRFDRVSMNKSKATSDEVIEQFKSGQPLFIVGSSWSIDESILIPFIKKNFIKTIIAPHNVDENTIKQLKEKLPNSALYTDGISEEIKTKNVLILNTIGQLSNAYNYGTIAYVGGGFTGRLHNILEPAVFGLPVLFGPKHERFPEAEFFLEEGIGFEVRSADDVENKINMILENLENISSKTSEFVSKNVGASQKIYEHISST